MLDINLVRTNPELVKASEKRRGQDPNFVDDVLSIDSQWRVKLKDVEKLKQQRNTVSQEINQAKKDKNEILAQEKISFMKGVVDNLKKLDDEVENLLKKRNESLKKIGNVLHESVPQGKDDSENVEIKKVGVVPKFDFKPKDHIEIALALDLIDLDTASKTSGARFYYLKNEAVLLSQALQRFAIDRIMKKGYTLIQTPFMLNRAALEGGVNMSEFEDTIYKIENEDLYLIATSEHPLVALRKDDIIDESELPVKICGVSYCFRKEIGTH